MSNALLRRIGRAISPSVRHSVHNTTRDGYTWFGSLEYKVRNAKVIILFLWHQNFNNAESKMDRSINVYTIKNCRKGL